MANSRPPIFHGCLVFLSPLSLSLLSLSASDPESKPSIHNPLRSKGLPAGLIPKRVLYYTLDGSGQLEVILGRPCLTKYDTRCCSIAWSGNLSYAALTDVVGLPQEELFLWLPVKDIIIDNPSSGQILFDIGVALKQLSRSLFDDPPLCKPNGNPTLSHFSFFFFSFFSYAFSLTLKFEPFCTIVFSMDEKVFFIK